MSLESQLIRSILSWCKSQGIWATKTHGSIYGTSGMPDLILLVPTHLWPVPVFLEVKQPGLSPRPLQRKRLADLRGVGAQAAVVHSVEDVATFVGKIKVLTSNF